MRYDTIRINERMCLNSVVGGHIRLPHMIDHTIICLFVCSNVRSFPAAVEGAHAKFRDVVKFDYSRIVIILSIDAGFIFQSVYHSICGL